MKRLAVIGNPIKHSLSPLLHNWVFKTLNIRAEYKTIRIKNEELPDIIQKIKNGKLDGINVTIPYKEKIIDFLDEINPRAKSIGSVNCIMKSDYKIIGNIHDEIQSEVHEKDAKVFGEIAVMAIKEAGEEFNLNCPLDGQYKVGETWQQTH